MIITCEACGTSFKIKTSLIKETGSTVRCSKCQQVFTAYPKSSENEKSTDFSLNKTLEEKIDDVLGDEFEDEFNDLESEITLDTAEISMTTSEEMASKGLFATADSMLDDMEEGSDEPEIMMSELEQDDDDIISLDSLAAGDTIQEAFDLESLLAEEDEDDSEILTFSDLGAKATGEDDSEILSFDEGEDDSEILTFSDLGAKATIEDDSEILSFGDIDQEDEEITLDDLEPTSELDEDVVGLDGLESDELAEAEIISTETIEDEEDIDFLDFEDGEVQPAESEDAEIEVEEELKDLAEPEKIAFETEGGVDTDLDDFDLEKQSEEEDTSKGFTEDAGKIAKEADKPAEEASKVEAEEEDFELDLDLEPEEAAEVPEDISIKEKDLGLDLELDGFEDLDLTEASPTEMVVEEDLGLDLDLGATAEEEDLGLDLDLDEFDDLDLDLGEDAEEFSTAEAAAEGEEADFDLDFDLGVEADAGAEEEAFELDLNIEPEPVEAESDDFDLDLDFDDDLGDASSVLSESFVDEGSATKTEAFDLTQIEDVLDFDELPEPEEVGAGDEQADLGMELEESESDTVSDDEEMSIDLETMLDDEAELFGDEKEVSLETVQEREEKIERNYKKTVIEEQEVPERTFDEFPEEVGEEYKEEIIAKAPVVKVGEKRNLKKLLIPLILLLAVGAIIYAGIQMFGGKEPAPVPPVVIDQGNFQMEMIANPEYTFVENKISGEILVVTGNVTNRYDHPRSNIQVKGTLYNNAGKVIVTSSAYCGNMLTASDLTTLELKTINERLNNRMGDNNLNAGIEPGTKIPFTIVFSNLPEDINELTAEVVQSSK